MNTVPLPDQYASIIMREAVRLGMSKEDTRLFVLYEEELTWYENLPEWTEKERAEYVAFKNDREELRRKYEYRLAVAA